MDMIRLFVRVVNCDAIFFDLRRVERLILFKSASVS